MNYLQLFVIKKTNPHVKLFLDSHADFNNNAQIYCKIFTLCFIEGYFSKHSLLSKKFYVYLLKQLILFAIFIRAQKL